MSVVITGLGVLAGSLVGFTLGCLWVALHDDAALGVVEDATVAVDAAFAAMASAQAEVARVERQSAIRAAVVTETHELLWQQAQMIESLEDRLLRALNERDELMRAATRIVPGTRGVL